ncbi:antitoxin [Bacilli bacterium]|nr:antitoxin [Bacilli bacterium]
MRNTSITLGDRFEAFTSEQVKSGRYGSVSEVVRAGLRILEEREIKAQALRMALQVGETSGITNYSLEGILKELEE